MTAVTQEGIPVVPVSDVERAVRDGGVPADQAAEVADDYGDAQMQGLKRALGAVGVFALLGLWSTRGLPGRPPARAERARAPDPDAHAAVV